MLEGRADALREGLHHFGHFPWKSLAQIQVAQNDGPVSGGEPWDHLDWRSSLLLSAGFPPSSLQLGCCQGLEVVCGELLEQPGRARLGMAQVAEISEQTRERWALKLLELERGPWREPRDPAAAWRSGQEGLLPQVL